MHPLSPEGQFVTLSEGMFPQGLSAGIKVKGLDLFPICSISKALLMGVEIISVKMSPH